VADNFGSFGDTLGYCSVMDLSGTSVAMVPSRFPPAEVASKIAVSLGIGLLVGIEREWSNKDLGARTFALTALLGTAGALFGPAMAIASLVGVLLIVLAANARSILVDRSLEATTSTALLVIFVLGALAGQGHLFTPVASAILMTMLLAWKGELRRFAGGLRPEEIRSAVLLGLIGLVVYPVLPDRFIDRWQLINPREAWITVIIIAGIGFANYVLLKMYGARGVYVSGFLGGFVNSSAAALELARPVETGVATGVALSAMLLTIVAMFVRNLLILAILSPTAVITAAGPLLAMSIVALVFVRRASKHDVVGPTDLHLELPVSLRRVLSFAALFLLIQILSTLGQRYLGKVGFLGISMLGGLVSSASTSAAAANMVGHQKMRASLAAEGVVLASVASAIINLPILYRNVKNPALLKRLSVFTTIVAMVGIALLVLQEYVLPMYK
jgi:uncharacterized membrane protein (DUF4010 family)